jgi:hypothetical protein
MSRSPSAFHRGGLPASSSVGLSENQLDIQLVLLWCLMYLLFVDIYLHPAQTIKNILAIFLHGGKRHKEKETSLHSGSDAAPVIRVGNTQCCRIMLDCEIDCATTHNSRAG